MARLPIWAIIVATAAVGIHELGHWSAARELGVRGTIAVSPLFGLTMFEEEPRCSRDVVLIFAAGPAANLVTAACAALVLNHTPMAAGFIRISLFLGIANLFPVPVLDGGRILEALTEGPGAARSMLQIMTTTGGCWFALVLGTALWGVDPIGALTLLALGLGSAASLWSTWKDTRERCGRRFFLRWLLLVGPPATALALLAATAVEGAVR